MTTTITECRTITPELGLFTIRGTSDEVALAAKSFDCKEVSLSKFEKTLYGRAYRHKLNWF